MILLVLLGCAAGVVMLNAKIAAIDERLTRLKELMARLSDQQQALESRPAGAALPAPAKATANSSTDVEGIVAKTVERATGDARARLEQAEARAAQLERDLMHVTGPALEELKRKLELVERRIADSTRNPFSSHGGRGAPAAEAEPAPRAAGAADPLAALAQGLARAQARLSGKAPAASGATDPVAVRVVESSPELTQALAAVDGVAHAGGGPLEREVAELAARLREFWRGIRQRAGQPVDGDAAPAPSLEQFVATHGDQLTGDARTRPVILLSMYLEHVSKASRGGAAAPAGGPLTERDVLEQVFTYVDALHDLRTRAAQWDTRSSGSERIAAALDKLFDELRNMLRAHQISVVAPDEGQVADPSSCRVAQTMRRPDLAPQTVVKVMRCGFKNTRSGEVLRLAEVITAS